MYFDNLINIIEKKKDFETLYKNLINPFSPYLLCNHSVSQENIEYIEYIQYDFINNNNINDLFSKRNYYFIKNYDIIYIETNLLELFVTDILPNIDKLIIIMTGKWYLPQIKKNNMSDYLLNHSNILLWISQNPIYINHPRYIPFPYGLEINRLETYSKQLLLPVNKTKHITFLPISNETNKCRKKLPKLHPIDSCEYYEKISNSEFVISPIGDRDDCYRHYECIGLGTIPISNVGETYKPLFQDNMYYCNIDGIVEIMNSNIIDISYSIPNRDFICFNYHRDIIMKRIEEIKHDNRNRNTNKILRKRMRMQFLG
jgi:hypothetical protein